MQDDYADTVLAELDDLLKKFSNLQVRGMGQAHGVHAQALGAEFVTGGMAAARRATGDGSQYVKQIEATIDEVGWSRIQRAIPIVGGMLKAVRQAVASGYLVTVRELVRAEVFTDFLDMAQYLLQEGYKDAAAVLVRGVLEEHLRELCDRKGIDTTYTDSRGKTLPKKLDTINADLKKAAIYPTTDQKSVTFWYGLGTDAAHGHYANYTPEQVKLMLQGVTDFIARHPA